MQRLPFGLPRFWCLFLKHCLPPTLFNMCIDHRVCIPTAYPIRCGVLCPWPSSNPTPDSFSQQRSMKTHVIMSSSESLGGREVEFFCNGQESCPLGKPKRQGTWALWQLLRELNPSLWSDEKTVSHSPPWHCTMTWWKFFFSRREKKDALAGAGGQERQGGSGGH